MDSDLKIPINERFRFAEPLDKLIEGTRKETILKVVAFFKELQVSGKEFQFHLVGDIVAHDFLGHSFLRNFIKTCIIDGKTQRKRVHIDVDEFFDDVIEFPNPAGMISKRCWKILKSAIDSGKITLLRITEGEEDLLVLPLVLLLSLDKEKKNFIFYGQPPITDAKVNIPQGIVIAELTEAIRKKVQDLVDIMERT